MKKQNIKRNFHFLHMLAKSHPTQRKALLKSANNKQIKSVCEVCLNILKGNVRVNVKKIKKYKQTLRKLAKRNISNESKKRVLVNQSGGFIPLIAPAIISAISGIIGKVISKKL